MKKESINKKEIMERITPIIEKVAGQLGLTVLEINFVKEAGRWQLKIFIYSPDHPISHKDCEDLTKNIDDYLDQIIPVPYFLEVSSPGTERKLKSPKEYNIFKGKKVEVKVKQPIDEDLKIFTAKIYEYIPGFGLRVQLLDTDKIVDIQENNISSVKLKADYKI